MGCTPSQRDRAYQKPKDIAQNTQKMKQALLLLKKTHPFYSIFLAHYETFGDINTTFL